MRVTFEIQHGVDDVLERLGPGEAAVLRHVSDQEDGRVRAFRREQQLRCRFADLSDAPGSRLELERKDGLNRIDNHQGGFDPIDLLENPLEAGFGEQIQGRRTDREPLAARFHLMFRFLA